MSYTRTVLAGLDDERLVLGGGVGIGEGSTDTRRSSPVSFSFGRFMSFMANSFLERLAGGSGAA